MKILGSAVFAVTLTAFVLYLASGAMPVALISGFGVICCFTTFQSRNISTFLKIFTYIFSMEFVLFAGIFLFTNSEWWPTEFGEYRIPETLPLTVAMFSVLVWVISHLNVVRLITKIADRYFESNEVTEARIWPFPSFRITDKTLAVSLVTLLVVINQVQVGINVRLSYFNRDWFNAIQNRDQTEFWRLLITVFLIWAATYIVIAIVEFVVQSVLLIRWRRWLTNDYVSRWLDGSTHYHMSLRGMNADNPDQRIAEDVNRFIDGGQSGYGIYSYSILLISTLSSLVSFSVILWTLSADFTIPGTEIAIPGFLFWVALTYSAIGTLITHLIGRSLVGLYFNRQRYEADFRFSLARLREYSEQIALLKGEETERKMAMGRFAKIYENYLLIVSRRKKLMAFTATYGQISPFIPYIVAAPFYFAGKIQLGVMSQTAGAFSSVESALGFFVTYYTSLADFKAVLDRLVGFDTSIAAAQSLEHQDCIRVQPSSENILSVAQLSLKLPDERKIVGESSFSIPVHQTTLVSGPSGSGKSTLFRAIAGIWPYGQGTINLPRGARVMLLPQKPYIPIGTLRAAIAYPSDADRYSDDVIRASLIAARLPDFSNRLDEEDNWAMRLSGGEQQRLGLARALLAKPDWLFLDEATAALDEESEAALYNTFAEKLPETTIVSIGHRSALSAFHKAQIKLKPDGHGAFVLDRSA